MIRVKRSKSRGAGTPTHTRRVKMQFVHSDGGTRRVLRMHEMKNCDLNDGVLQTLPEWEYMLDSNGNKFGCNIPNTLEVGSFKADMGGKAFENIYYLITKAGSYLHHMADLNGFYAVATNRIQVTPFFVKVGDEPRVALCTRKGFLLEKMDGSYETIIEEGTLAVGALYKHRIFLGMPGGVVKYSVPEGYEQFDPTADESGEMAFPHCGGEIIAIKPFKDALYIFFKSGIVRLEASGEPSGFYAERLDYTGGDIFSRTICVCQHAVYFLARNGMYRLREKKAELLDLKVELPQEETGFEGCSVWKDRPIIRYSKGGPKTRSSLPTPLLRQTP